MGLRFILARRLSGEKSAGSAGLGGGLSSASNVIAIVSVALSVFVMILAVAISDGFKKEIREKAVGYSGDMIICAKAADITDWKSPLQNTDFSKLFSRFGEIKRADAVNYRFGLLKTSSEIQGVLFKGVRSGYDKTFFAEHLVEGQLPNFLSGNSQQISNEILVSRRLSDILGYKVGGKVTAYFIGTDIKVRRFVISGLYDAQLEELDKITVLVDASQVAVLNGWTENEVSGYEIRINAVGDKEYPRRLQLIKNKLEEAIEEGKSYSDVEQGVSVVPVTESSQVLFDWLRLLDMNVIIIIGLMIAVAGFNMVSGILIILFERTSAIGLLKSLGMRSSDIIIVFLYKASGIVLKGLLIGNILAAAFCLLESKYGFVTLNPENYFVKYVPVSISPVTFLLIDAIAFISIMMILLIPSHFISRVSPAKTLKFD
jgi:lipoprotein-releasing system permease protein